MTPHQETQIERLKRFRGAGAESEYQYEFPEPEILPSGRWIGGALIIGSVTALVGWLLFAVLISAGP